MAEKTDKAERKYRVEKIENGSLVHILVGEDITPYRTHFAKTDKEIRDIIIEDSKTNFPQNYRLEETGAVFFKITFETINCG